MILCRSPFRVSFAGGFSDVAALHGGAPGEVVSCTIGHYATMALAREVNGDVVATYSTVERVPIARDLKNELFRACLEVCGVDRAVQIHSIATLPLSGSGLGGSGAACVSLVNALHRYRGCDLGTEILAEMACRVEIDVLQRKIGKQDQYAATYGGLNAFRFDGRRVDVRRLDFGLVAVLRGLCVLVPCARPYGPTPRNAGVLLDAQLRAGEETAKHLSGVVPAVVSALERRDVATLISCVNESWDVKRTLSTEVSCPDADAVITEVRALGGGAKLCGAGGGGYVFGILPSELIADQFLAARSTAIPCGFESEGSRIVYDDWERHPQPWTRGKHVADATQCVREA